MKLKRENFIHTANGLSKHVISAQDMTGAIHGAVESDRDKNASSAAIRVASSIIEVC